MRILITADIHLSGLSRDAYRFDFQKWLRKQVEKHDIDRVYILGDLTEAKDNHSATLVNRVVECIHRLSKVCDVTILRGNHDGLTPDNPFFAFVKRFPYILWISEPTRIGDHLFLPYTPNYKKDWGSLIRSGEYAETPIHFCHQTFSGVRAESGHILTDDVPLSIVPAGECENGVRVFSGDIHTPQQCGPVVYVGAPYTIDFGDNFEPRIIILEGSKWTSISVPGPQKRLIEVKSVDRLSTDMAAEGDIVKIKIECTASDFNRWHDIRATAQAYAKEEGWQVNAILPVIEIALTNRDKVATVAKTRSDKELIEAFAQRQGLDDATLKVGLKFIS